MCEAQTSEWAGDAGIAAAAVVGAGWPPEGFVDRHGAARMLGVVTLTLKRYVDLGKVPRPRWFVKPNGGRSLLYAVDDLMRARREIAEAAARPATMPAGFVDRDGACRIFGVVAGTWVVWEREGRVPKGEWGRSRTNKPCRIYAVAALERVMEQMRAETVRPDRENPGGYHIPPGYVRQREAARMFGVEYATFHRWELQGRLACQPHEKGAGIKLYRTEDVERLVQECGRYAPPYPDPQRPGVWRVPLAGRDIERREAIVDEVDVPLVRDGRCHWSARARGREDGGAVMLWDGRKHRRLRQAILGVSGTRWRVGHRNGDPLDCTRGNLFVRTMQEQERGQASPRGTGASPARRGSRALPGRSGRADGARPSWWTAERPAWAASGTKSPRARPTTRRHGSCSASTRG